MTSIRSGERSSDPLAALLTPPDYRSDYATSLDTSVPWRNPSEVEIAGRHYTVVRPRIRDPRFHLAAVIISLHVLGQTVLDFDVSILQILAAVGTAGLIGFVVTLVSDRTIAWPASAVLAGNGVAFILRVPGTQHGEWWSARGWWIFSATAALGLASKYVIRWKGRHIFNPSNFGLVVAFLVLGSNRADPLPFWWGPQSGATIAALVVIGVGGVAIVIRLGIAAIAVSFWVAFASSLAVVAASDHCLAAPWHLGPVCGREFWWTLVTSPEILVFMFFMITDPKSSPTGRVRRVVYGASIGFLATLLASPQTTEFATKVAVLSALAIVCAARPLFEPRLPAADASDDRLGRFVLGFRHPGRLPLRPLAVAATIVVTGTLLVVLAPNSIEATATASETDGSVAARPEFGPDELSRPEVVVNPSDRVAARLEPATVTAIGRDVTEDLAIIERARREQRPALLATATGESTLETLDRALAKEMATGSVEVSTTRLDVITISVARRVGQGNPAIMVTLEGVESHADGPTTDVHDTYEVKTRAGRWVLVTDDIPPGFTPP